MRKLINIFLILFLIWKCQAILWNMHHRMFLTECFGYYGRKSKWPSVKYPEIEGVQPFISIKTHPWLKLKPERLILQLVLDDESWQGPFKQVPGRLVRSLAKWNIPYPTRIPVLILLSGRCLCLSCQPRDSGCTCLSTLLTCTHTHPSHTQTHAHTCSAGLCDTAEYLTILTL